MEINMEREYCALGGLFQQIINDMKNGTPLWEDFIAKATKLHSCLRATVQAIAAYLDSFQKIADAATNARGSTRTEGTDDGQLKMGSAAHKEPPVAIRQFVPRNSDCKAVQVASLPEDIDFDDYGGATKEIGTALTRICLRHKALEARMKTFTSAIMDCLILPLQEKLEDWKKIVINLDKEHAKEYKRARTELKKRSTDTLRLQKKAKKGKCGELQRRVETSLQDVSERRHFLEETEKKALRAALIEERSRFCVFVGFFKPVVSEEVAMLSELTHIQEMAEQLDKISADPHILPPSSEQVIQDLKGSDSFWSFQTPPSSPSSLGSRKSSMCSISSLNSSSSGSSKSHNSPNHYWQRSASQNGPLHIGTLPRLSSISSQDSGFRSQDALFLKRPPSGSQVSNMSEQSDNSNSSTPSTPHADPNAVPAATSTWPNLQETLQFERAASAIMKERPHTISSEASLSQPASPVSISTAVSGSSSSTSPPVLSNSSTPHVSPQAVYSRPPIPQRCSSLERPSVPCNKPALPNGQIIKTEAAKSVLSKVQARLPSDPLQAPMYVNMSELACMAASKAQEMAVNLPPPPPELTDCGPEKAEPAEKDGSTSESSLESSSGYGSQTTFPNDEHTEDVRLEITSFDPTKKLCTLPRAPLADFNVSRSQRPLSTPGFVGGTLRGNILRKGSMVAGQKPPPPIRRTASISSTSRQSLLGNVDNTGSLENLPPPPSFLLDAGGSTESLQQTPTVKDVQSMLQNVFTQRNSSPSPSSPAPSTVRVAETVRTLTELKHTPASPNAVRRSSSVIRSQSAERRESVGSGLIAALSAKIAPNLSPRHSRRHSEDMIARNLSQGSMSPISGRLLQRGMVTSGQNFLESLNAKLALQQQVQQNQLKIHNAARVRQLFAGKTVSDPTVCHDSLMDQIKKGTSLKKTRTINDRSAPIIH